MNRPRWSTLVLAALVILWAGPPLSGQAPAADLIDAINKRDEPRLRCCSSKAQTRMLVMLVTQPAITAAAYFGLEKTVQALLASGADTAAVDNDGAGALHAAALGGHAGCRQAAARSWPRGERRCPRRRDDADGLRCGARPSERHASAAGTPRGRQPRRLRRQFSAASRRDARPHRRGASLAGVRRECQRRLQAWLDTLDGGRVGRRRERGGGAVEAWRQRDTGE